MAIGRKIDPEEASTSARQSNYARLHDPETAPPPYESVVAPGGPSQPASGPSIPSLPASQMAFDADAAAGGNAEPGSARRNRRSQMRSQHDRTSTRSAASSSSGSRNSGDEAAESSSSRRALRERRHPSRPLSSGEAETYFESLRRVAGPYIWSWWSSHWNGEWFGHQWGPPHQSDEARWAALEMARHQALHFHGRHAGYGHHAHSRHHMTDSESDHTPGEDSDTDDESRETTRGQDSAASVHSQRPPLAGSDDHVDRTNPSSSSSLARAASLEADSEGHNRNEATDAGAEGDSHGADVAAGSDPRVQRRRHRRHRRRQLYTRDHEERLYRWQAWIAASAEAAVERQRRHRFLKVGLIVAAGTLGWFLGSKRAATGPGFGRS
ncbi:unnamed protein product [Parajaminaea phylloscopi]